jgi:RNA polymerase sigma-70 factor (ECF subfamily)
LDFEDRGRFEETFLPHLDAAYNLARWLTQDGLSAEDIVQDAFCRALKFFSGYRGGDARSWLLAVVRRAAFDWLAKWKQPAASYDEGLHGRADDSLGPEAMALRQADRELVREALEALHEEFREVIVLRELEGMSYQQIATVTGAPVGTVMSRLSRARGLLQRRLARCSGEEG